VFILDKLKENIDYFGIDIGSSSLKIVQLKKSFGKYELIAFGSAPLEKGIAQSDSALDQKKVSGEIKKLAHSMHLVTKNAVVSLPGSTIFTTIIKLPKMPENELKKAILYQAEQNIPLKIDDVRIDYQIIGVSENTGEISVMIIAAPKAKTQKMSELIDDAGLDLQAVEVNYMAVSRSLHANEELYAIVDIGTLTTEITVVQNGVMSLARSVPIGGQVITRAIAQDLNIEEDQAEQFKIKFGVDKERMEGKLFKAAKPIMKNLAEEIDRSVKYYMEEKGQAIPMAKLTGGGSKLQGLQPFFAEQLGISVVYGNPWNSVVHKPDVTSQLNQNASEFAIAVGLAMRGL